MPHFDSLDNPLLQSTCPLPQLLELHVPLGQMHVSSSSDDPIGPLPDDPSSSNIGPFDPLISSMDNTNSGRVCRVKLPSIRHYDYVGMVPTLSPPFESHPTTGSQGTVHPLENYINYAKFSTRHRIFLANISIAVEPRSFKEAKKSDGWRMAMSNEIKALEDNNTWEMTSLSHGKKAFGCKWVYKVKFHADESIKRLKARLVILGNYQVEGLD